jgi:hypothetical protein
LARGAQHRDEARKIVARCRLLDQVPAYSVARGSDARFLEALVILERKLVVPCGGNEIETDAGEATPRFAPRQTIQKL